MKNFKVGLVQQKGSDDKNVALQESYQGIKKAAEAGCQLVVLQELHAGPYFCQHESMEILETAETIPGPTADFLSQAAKEFKVVIVGSIFEKRAVGVYHNTAIVFEKDGSIAGKYRKMHIPDDPGYYEKYYFAPGDLGFKPIQTSLGKLGVLVCWDQWYPEAARIMALNGADILIYPTAIGWFPTDSRETQEELVDAWMTSQRGHSIANCLPVVACNRIGFEKDPSGVTEGIIFWGNSFVTGAHGKILARASSDQSEVLIAEVNYKDTEEKRHTWPFLRDRRIDAYDDLLCRYVE